MKKSRMADSGISAFSPSLAFHHLCGNIPFRHISSGVCREANKREAGEKPVRSRHCNRERNLTRHCPIRMRRRGIRSRPGSQETCRSEQCHLFGD
jgi:hypothetical protein